jgi:hypothetical protein
VKLVRLTTIDHVHIPGRSELARTFRSESYDLKPDANGVRICDMDAFTYVPWANVLDAEGFEDKKK